MKAYTGIVTGENAWHKDLDVNPLNGKKRTTSRASGSDATLRFPPFRVTLELEIPHVNCDEPVVVTPKIVRL